MLSRMYLGESIIRGLDTKEKDIVLTSGVKTILGRVDVENMFYV